MNHEGLLGLLGDLYGQLSQSEAKVKKLEAQNTELDAQLRKVLTAARLRQAELQAQAENQPPASVPAASESETTDEQ